MIVATDDDYICEHCTRIPLESLLDWVPNFYEMHQETNTLRCKLCELLSKHKQQLKNPRPNLCGWRVNEKHGFFGRYTCGDSEDPFIAVSKLRPDELKRRMRDVYPEKAGVDSVISWMKTCHHSHGTHCAPKPANLLKRLKVIDCSARTVIDAPPDCKYLALSYVWGSLSTLGPTHSTQTNSKELLGSNALYLPKIVPKTIEDSLALVAMLGHRYLWVDRYCIDDNDKNEKHAQIQQMGDIYASAQLTIVAAAGIDPSHGLPGVTEARMPMPALNYVQSGNLTFCNYPQSGTNDIADSIWASRAWTFQEGFLSRKRLFFTERQMIYICQESIAADALRDFSLPRRNDYGFVRNMLPTSRISGIHGIKAGQLLIESYSGRNLSIESDALDAISGALNTLHYYKTPTQNVCGVVCCRSGYKGSEFLTIALNWFHKAPCSRRESFPSWTSLGWTGQVVHRYEQPRVPDNCLIKVGSNAESFIDLESWIDQYSPHTARHNIPSYLEITAPVVPIDLELVSSSDGEAGKKVLHARTCIETRLNFYARPDWDTYPSDNDVQNLIGIIYSSRHDYFSHRSYCYFLLIRPKGPFYERIGVLTWYSDLEVRSKHSFLMSDDGRVLTSDEFGKELPRVMNVMKLKMNGAKTKTIVLI